MLRGLRAQNAHRACARLGRTIRHLQPSAADRTSPPVSVSACTRSSSTATHGTAPQVNTRRDLYRVQQRMRGLFDELSTMRRAGVLTLTNTRVCEVVTDLQTHYQCLPLIGKALALTRFTQEFGVDHTRVDSLIEKVRLLRPGPRGDAGAPAPAPALHVQDANNKALLSAIGELRSSLQPSYEQIFDELLALPSLAEFVVQLRADLLRVLSPRNQTVFESLNARGVFALRTLEQDLRSFLARTFKDSSLFLQRIHSDSGEDLLAKVLQYEAVHPITTRAELVQRVGASRRVYALFHPCMPREPLVILNVALQPHLSSNVQSILREDTSSLVCPPRACVFYSVSATQPGLRGVELAGELIRKASSQLVAEFPAVAVMSTLSPVPGFVSWLRSRPAHMRSLVEALQRPEGQNEDPITAAAEHLQRDSDTKQLKSLLLQCMVEYLVVAKRVGGRPHATLDPVQNFHLSNGAELYRLNWMADASPHGMRGSLGMMVNYRYPLDADRKSRNATSYISEGRVRCGHSILHTAQHIQTTTGSEALALLSLAE